VRKINLKGEKFSDNKQKKEYQGGTSFIVGIMLLILATSICGGMYFLKSSQAKKIITIKADITKIKKELDKNKDFQNVYNFQDLLLELKTIIKDKVVQTNLLDQIAEATINDSTVQSVRASIVNGLSDVDMNLKVADFGLLAKQINAYNQVNIKRQAVLKGASLKEEDIEAKISFFVDNEILKSKQTITSPPKINNNPIDNGVEMEVDAQAKNKQNIENTENTENTKTNQIN